ncbi:MAG: 3'-5' exonuclease [Thiobacillaceae bacterium]
MTLLSRLFRRRPKLSPHAEAQLQSWRSLPRTDLHTSFATSRYVVVDVETGGLDPTRDKLIAIGAVAVKDGQISLDDAFEVVLQQATPSTHDNILVHGIGGKMQTAGNDPGEALLQFLNFAGKVPLVAFHAAFDETAIRLAIKKHLGADFTQSWLDLAYLAPALHPELMQHHRSLDDWMGEFGIGNFARHSALADAYSTAQLFLVLMNAKQNTNAQCFADLLSLEKAQRTLARMNQ